MSQLIRDRKTPGSTWGWLLIMVLVPYVGVPLYLTLGGRKLKRKASQKERLYRNIPFSKTSSDLSPIERILMATGGPKRSSDNRVKTLPSGRQTYFEMIEMIRHAKESVWITTYILGNDSVGGEILKTLTEQARKGIDVCLLLDGLGSFWTSRHRLSNLKKAGGKVAFFLPLIHIPFFGHSNLRNHRKLLIVDEKAAIFGGMNLAQEYLGPESDDKHWIDLCFLIEGSGVDDLATVFRSDWAFASKEKREVGPKKEKIQISKDIPKLISGSLVQIVGSGPDVSGDPLYDSILSAIFSAQKRIWMTTPYFIPDETLAKALELACLRGVDVRIIIPKRSNHFLADLCRGSYLRQMDVAGCKLYFDLHPMMHAKVTLFDDSYVVVGSANMDMRSLLLNYEIGLFLYSKHDIETIACWFDTLQNQAKEEHLKRTPTTDFLDGLGRILGPVV